jgi:transposase
VRVPPRMMAGARQAVRALGKSDPIDALAVARAALREPDLPSAGHDQASWEVKLLVDHREQLIVERTRTINRLRWHLHQLDPDLERPARRLPGPSLDRVAAWLAGAPSSVQVAICQELTATIAALTARIDRLTGQLRQRVAQLAPNLLSLPGCGVLTAAKLIAETAGVARFRSEACFAMHAGVAPIPVSSGRTDRHRLYRGGNRQLNAAVHRIAITQLRLPGPGQIYYRRRRALGDRTGDAVRALKRRIARAVYQQLKLAEQRLPTTAPVAARQRSNLAGPWPAPGEQLGEVRVEHAELVAPGVAHDWLGERWATTINLRPKTRDRDELLLRRLALPSFGAVPLAAISQRDVLAWVADLSARGLAPATVQKAYQLLGKIMGAAVDAGMLAQSPCRRVALPKVEREEMRFLTPAEVTTLADAIKARYRALVLVGAYGGLRIGELAGLRRGRVDVLRGTVTVAEIVVEVRGVLHIGPPKTRASRRLGELHPGSLRPPVPGGRCGAP